MSSVAISGLILLFLIFPAKKFTNRDQNCRVVLPHLRQNSLQSQRQKTNSHWSSIEISLQATPRAFEFVYFTVAGHMSPPLRELKSVHITLLPVLLKQVYRTGFNEQRESAKVSVTDRCIVSQVSHGSALTVVEQKLYKYGKLMASNTIKPYWESTVAMYNMNKTIVESGWIYRLCRLRVVPHFSSGIVERAKRERAWKSTHARKGDTFCLPPRVAFSRVGWFSRAHAFCSLYYPWGKMGDYS